MGWTLTGVRFRYHGKATSAHPDGNNMAWKCPRCGHPVLFVYFNGRKGSSENRPTFCLHCE